MFHEHSRSSEIARLLERFRHPERFYKAYNLYWMHVPKRFTIRLAVLVTHVGCQPRLAQPNYTP